MARLPEASAASDAARGRSQALTFPFAGPPGPGESLEILPGIHWVRFPLPLKLDHVNVWFLEDGDGWTAVDTGVGDERTWGLWARSLSALDTVAPPTLDTVAPPAFGAGTSGRRPEGRRLRRLLVTHHHPDHCGLADRLTEAHGAELLMSASAHEAGLVLQHREKGTDARSTAGRLAAHGLSPEAQEYLVRNEAQFAMLKPGLPDAFTALDEDDTATAGAYRWQVIFGQGHAPDHVCLYSEDGPQAGAGDGSELSPGANDGAAGRSGAGRPASGRAGILISGDMVLPHISTHVGSPATWLPGNPVALFQQSVRRLADLPNDTIVLPSHGEPFVGLRERVAELEMHHEERCRTIAAALDAPRSAAELLQVVFQRELDPLQLMLAMNEAIAHLEYMTGRDELERVVGEDGITRYVRIDAR